MTEMVLDQWRLLLIESVICSLVERNYRRQTNGLRIYLYIYVDVTIGSEMLTNPILI